MMAKRPSTTRTSCSSAAMAAPPYEGVRQLAEGEGHVQQDSHGGGYDGLYGTVRRIRADRPAHRIERDLFDISPLVLQRAQQVLLCDHVRADIRHADQEFLLPLVGGVGHPLCLHVVEKNLL